ncbi:MAG: B12 binding domain of Methylmalonyl-CoA mutase, partial [uncultured Rubrobacteraceae bacterium]
GRYDKGGRRKSRARRARPGGQDHRARPARRGDGGDLHRAPPDPRAGRRGDHTGGRRRHRHLHPLRRAHDAPAPHNRPPQGERRRGRPRVLRRHHPQRGHPEAQGARRRRGLHPRNPDEKSCRVPPGGARQLL